LASLEKIEDMKIKGKIGYDSFSKNMGDTLTLQTGKLSCVFNTSLNSHLFPYIGDLHCNLNDLMRGNTELNINWFSKPGVLPNRKNLIVKARLQADSLNLDYLPYPLPDTKGKVSFDLALLSLGGRQNKVTLNCRLDSTRYNQELIGTGEHNLKANIFIRIDETQSEFFMDTCLVALDKVLACQLQGYYGTESQKINLDLKQATIDNAELISFFPQNIAQNLTLSGYENIQASVMFTSLPERFSSFSASIGFLSTGLNLFPQRIFINDLQGKVDFRGSLKNIRGEGNMVVNTIRIPELRSSPLEDSSIDLKVELDSLTTVLLNTVVISLPSLKFGGEINGSLQNLTSVSSARIKGKAAFAFDSPDTVEIINNILITGKIMTNLQAATNDSTNSNIHITGSLGTESLAIDRKNNLHIRNIQSSLPFSFNYDLNTKLLVKSPADSIPLKNNYRNKRFLYHSLFPEIGRLTLESVQISNYQIDRIDTDILCSGNRIQLPWIGINLFDGIIAGDLYLNLNTGKLSEITYTITGNANRINSAAISRMKPKEKKKSDLDATFKFEGKGLNIAEIIDVSGYFHITNLGSDFASNLLSSIDPSGSDRSIKMTKQLINTGWKPGIFSFELRHGYVYPSFNLHQPWFSPVRLPERLEYGRLPLSFFLKSK
jgi:hypothetical protein